MQMTHYFIFTLIQVGLSDYCYTYGGEMYDCECCVSGYPYDECYSGSECTDILIWIISFWAAFWAIIVLSYGILYCRSKSKMLTRMDFIRSRAMEAQAQKQVVNYVGKQNIPQQYIGNPTQQFEITENQIK